ncbi:MAG: hypothetical protein GX443_04970 [Deltaproteobacteria bacterium]|nr:hypothetical protein [Deltaproteobacteria bacterium]
MNRDATLPKADAGKYLASPELHALLMAMPVKERLRAILEREDARETVEALSPQDFFFTVMELGREDAIPLLTMARVQQLDLLFGLEWWGKDRVQPAKALEWIDLLARGSRRKLLEWLSHADFELLVTLFKKWIHVAAAPEEIDPLEAMDQLPANTLDDHFYWDARYPQHEDLLKNLLSILFEVNRGFYTQLLQHVIWASEAEMEEEAYRFHRGRMEDQAIPDFFDALEIYRAVSTREILPRQVGVMDSAIIDSPAPAFAFALVPRGDLLAAAVRGIEDRGMRDTLQWELAALANKVVTADRMSLEAPETLRKAMDKAAACVSLGMETLAMETGVGAPEIVQTCFLEHLFRLGHSQAVQIRNRMQRILRTGWLSRWPHGLHCIDPEWNEAVELLLEPTPRILRQRSKTDTLKPAADHMRNREDLRYGEALVAMIEALRKVYEALDPRADCLQAVIWYDGHIRGMEDVTIGAMVLTAAANCTWRRRWNLEPIVLGEWPDLFPRLVPEELAATLFQGLNSWVADNAEGHMLQNYMQPVLDAYAREMEPFLQERKVPDPRLVRFFLFRED